jgi:hypothetical protein
MKYVKVSAALAVSMMVSALSTAQTQSHVPGCYVASRGLTYSAAGALERGDTSWSHIRLSADGIARRPMLKNNLDRRSSWALVRDSLRITFSDGLVGWRLQLTPTKGGWAGTATYLTDAPAVGLPPYQSAINLKRESCAPA